MGAASSSNEGNAPTPTSPAGSTGEGESLHDIQKLLANRHVMSLIGKAQKRTRTHEAINVDAPPPPRSTNMSHSKRGRGSRHRRRGRGRGHGHGRGNGMTGNGAPAARTGTGGSKEPRFSLLELDKNVKEQKGATATTAETREEMLRRAIDRRRGNGSPVATQDQDHGFDTVDELEFMRDGDVVEYNDDARAAAHYGNPADELRVSVNRDGDGDGDDIIPRPPTPNDFLPPPPSPVSAPADADVDAIADAEGMKKMQNNRGRAPSPLLLMTADPSRAHSHSHSLDWDEGRQKQQQRRRRGRKRASPSDQSHQSSRASYSSRSTNQRNTSTRGSEISRHRRRRTRHHHHHRPAPAATATTTTYRVCTATAATPHMSARSKASAYSPRTGHKVYPADIVEATGEPVQGADPRLTLPNGGPLLFCKLQGGRGFLPIFDVASGATLLERVTVRGRRDSNSNINGTAQSLARPHKRSTRTIHRRRRAEEHQEGGEKKKRPSRRRTVATRHNVHSGGGERKEKAPPRKPVGWLEKSLEHNSMKSTLAKLEKKLSNYEERKPDVVEAVLYGIVLALEHGAACEAAAEERIRRELMFGTISVSGSS